MTGKQKAAIKPIDELAVGIAARREFGHTAIAAQAPGFVSDQLADGVALLALLRMPPHHHVEQTLQTFLMNWSHEKSVLSWVKWWWSRCRKATSNRRR